MSVTVSRATDPGEIAACIAVRREVFIDEQNVAEALELDGLDAAAEHYLLRVDGAVVGAARVRYVGDQAKIERVAIVKPHRGNGLGRTIMAAILAILAGEGRVNKAVLGSQVHAIPFYASLGFVAFGPEYMDAGIPHRDMEKVLPPPNNHGI